jgi:MoaA/NifB/PqqE/SkfB family radical SAM enzyme
VLSYPVSPTFAWKVRFLRDFLCGNTSRGGPFCAYICLTNRCNLRCHGCRFHAPDLEQDPAGKEMRSDLPLDAFSGLLEELKRMGTRKLILSGEGEPMLHPQFTEMTERAVKAFYFTSLITNGTLLTESKVIFLLQSGLQEIRISLWAANQEEYKLQSPDTKGALFHQVLEGIRALTTRKKLLGGGGPAVILHRPISRQQYRTLADSVQLAASTGCNGITFAPIRPRTRGDTALLPTAEELAEIIGLLKQAGRQAHALNLVHNASEVISRYQAGPNVWESAPCYIGWSDLRISSSGDATFCCPCNRKLGNAIGEPFQSIWNGPAARRFRQMARTREGLDRIRHDCLCDYCCHLPGNLRIHSYLGWLPKLHSHISEESHS